jgi:hypothetical protein
MIQSRKCVMYSASAHNRRAEALLADRSSTYYESHDAKNVNGVRMPWGDYARENLTGAVFHDDKRRVLAILNLKVGKQDIEEVEGGIGSPYVAMTALGIAASKGNSDMVSLLLEHNANPDGTGTEDDYYTATPLVAAVKSGNIEVLEMLLKFHPDVDSTASMHPDTLGVTAMYVAASKNRRRMVEMLWNAGASTRIESGHGVSPARIAARNGYVELAHWLESRPARDRFF